MGRDDCHSAHVGLGVALLQIQLSKSWSLTILGMYDLAAA